MEQTIVFVSPDETAADAATLSHDEAAADVGDDAEQTPCPVSQHLRSRIIRIDDLGRLTGILRGGREVRACVVGTALSFGRG